MALFRILPRRVILLIVLALVGAIVAVACGDDDDEATPGTATPAGETPAGAVLDPIEVGVAAPFSGPIAYYGEFLVDAVLDLVREDFGTTITYDDGSTAELNFTKIDEMCSPTEGVNAVNRVLDKVVVMLGPTCSLATIAVAPILGDNEIPSISPSYNPLITSSGNEWIFVTVANSEQMGTALAQWIIDQGVTHLALATDTSSYGEEAAIGLLAALEVTDIETTDEIKFDLGSVDFSGQVLRILDSDADGIFIASYEVEAGLFTKQLAQLGNELPIFLTDGLCILSPYYETAGDAKDGVSCAAIQVHTDPDPEVQSFIDRFNEAEGFENFTDINSFYNAYVVLLDALKRAGPNPTGEQIRDALRETDVDTIFGRVRFDENGVLRDPRIVIGQWQDGILEYIADVSPNQ